MKKRRAKPAPRLPVHPDEILPEYDFTKGRRNKYAKRFQPGSRVVVVEPALAALFPDTQAVNDALRAIATVIEGRSQRKKPRARRSA